MSFQQTRRSLRPLGRPTRGKTAPNRLRKTDTFLLIAYLEWVRHLDGFYVDLGYGAYPHTTLETLRRLRRINASLRILGVEIDPERVLEARTVTEAGLEFRRGGFNLPLEPGERVSVIRMFNVLRQYPEGEVVEALDILANQIVEGGLLLEGTCDPAGRLLTFNLFQKHGRQLERIALVLAPSLSAAFLPRQFQAVLPKNFIHHAESGGPIDEFFAAWHAAWQSARRQTLDRRRVFQQAALRLADQAGYSLDRRPTLLRRGFLCLGPDWPAHRQAVQE